jgi:hypothetical protein
MSLCLICKLSHLNIQHHHLHHDYVAVSYIKFLQEEVGSWKGMYMLHTNRNRSSQNPVLNARSPQPPHSVSHSTPQALLNHEGQVMLHPVVGNRHLAPPGSGNQDSLPLDKGGIQCHLVFTDAKPVPMLMS